MQFFDHPTIYETAKRFDPGLRVDAMYADTRQSAFARGDRITYNQAVTEQCWWDLRRPYYNVWPGIIGPLCRIDLDKVPCGEVSLPTRSLAFRFAEGCRRLQFEWDGQVHQIRSLLASDMAAEGERQTLVLWLDCGEREFSPILTYRYLPLFEYDTVGEALEHFRIEHASLAYGVQIPYELTVDCVRIVVACSLMDDSGLIEPDVLNADRAKWERTGDMKYVEKAHRRGKLAWHVGRQGQQACPHWRGPHPCLFWVGPQRKRPVVRIRRGTVVHREKVAQKPSGFLGDGEGDEGGS